MLVMPQCFDPCKYFGSSLRTHVCADNKKTAAEEDEEGREEERLNDQSRPQVGQRLLGVCQTPMTQLRSQDVQEGRYCEYSAELTERFGSLPAPHLRT